MIGFYDYTIIATSLSMLCGVLGIYYATIGSPLGAILFLMFSGAIDIFDGKIAHTKEQNIVEKRFGYITDALADTICYGVLPVVIAFTTSSYKWWQVILVCFYPIAVMIRLAYVSICQEARIAQGNPRVKYYEGFPVSYISIILPLLYLIHSLSTSVFSWIYFFALIILIPAMLLKYKVPKPKFKTSLYILGFGAIEMILLLILGKN